MILSPKFVKLAENKPWKKQFSKFIADYEKTSAGTYVIPDAVWEDFLVDIGQKKSRGLGDTIAKITKKVGIKPCGGCQKRRKMLNKKIKYGKS